jgi:hypothetical protein
VVLCNGDELLDVVRNGQGVLNVLPLRTVKADVDARIVAIRLDGTALPATGGAAAEAV